MQKDTSVNNGDGKKKWTHRRRWVILGVIYLLVVLLIACVVNSRHLEDFINFNISAFRPVLIGLLIAYITNPLYNFLHDNIFTWEKKAQAVRKTVSMVFTYAVIVLFITVIVLLLLPQLTSSIQDLSNNIQTYLDETFAFVNEILGKLPFDIPEITADSLVDMITGSTGETGTLPGAEEPTLGEKLQGVLNNIVNLASSYVVEIANLVMDLVIGLFIAGYTLASKQRIAAQIRRVLTALFREKGAKSILEFVRETDKTFGRYVLGKLLDSMLVVVVACVVFTLAKLPYAVLIGVIIGVANIIPFFGPILGAIPCGVLVFIAEPRKLITFIILVLVVQQIDANITDPLITGNATGLSSLGVIVAVTVMGNYFGIIGMFIGVPATVSILSLCKRFMDRKLEADNMPTELEPYYPPKTEEIDKGTGEHIPFFTALVLRYRARKQMIEARKDAKKAASAAKRSGGSANITLTESAPEEHCGECNDGDTGMPASPGEGESASGNDDSREVGADNNSTDN